MSKKGNNRKITAEDLFGGDNENVELKKEESVKNVLPEEEVVQEQVQLEIKDIKETLEEITNKELPEDRKGEVVLANAIAQTFENISAQPATTDKIEIGDNDNKLESDNEDAFSPTMEEVQQANTNKINNLMEGFNKMEQQAQVGVSMEKAGVIRTFKFSEAIKMILGNNYSDDVIFRVDITPQKLVEMAKGNTDIAAKISSEIYLNSFMPVAWLISLKPENYTTAGEYQPHILQGGNFNRQTVDVNKIVANYGEYMIKGADGTVTPYIDAEPFAQMTGTATITAILSSKRIFNKLAKMVADVEGIVNHKYRIGITLNAQSPKDSLVVLTVLSPMGNTLIK